MYNYVNMIKDNGLFIELKHASQEQTHQKLSSVEALFLKCEPGIWVARRQDAPGVVQGPESNHEINVFHWCGHDRGIDGEECIGAKGRGGYSIFIRQIDI